MNNGNSVMASCECVHIRNSHTYKRVSKLVHAGIIECMVKGSNVKL